MCFSHGRNRTAFTWQISHLNISVRGGFWHGCSSGLTLGETPMILDSSLRPTQLLVNFGEEGYLLESGNACILWSRGPNSGGLHCMLWPPELKQIPPSVKSKWSRSKSSPSHSSLSACSG